MKIISESCTLDELRVMVATEFGDLVKAVVDVERGIMALDAELHADLETLLLDDGSHQQNLWGINLYPELSQDEGFIEFDSMINMRPSQGNMTRGVDDPAIQEKIKDIVQTKITT